MPAPPTKSERQSIAGRVQMRRREKYGSKSAAYQAAGLNSATWDRIEAGEVVREDRLLAALKTLWPESGGDWSAIGTSKIDHPVFTGQYDDPQYLAKIESWVMELQERLEAVEGYVAHIAEQQGKGGSSDGRTPEAEKSNDEADVVVFDDSALDVTPPGRMRLAARTVDPKIERKGAEG